MHCRANVHCIVWGAIFLKTNKQKNPNKLKNPTKPNQIFKAREKSFLNKGKINISGEVLFSYFSVLQLHLEYCIQLGPQQKKAVDKLQGVQDRPPR